jgi:hypothetical protein
MIFTAGSLRHPRMRLLQIPPSCNTFMPGDGTSNLEAAWQVGGCAREVGVEAGNGRVVPGDDAALVYARQRARIQAQLPSGDACAVGAGIQLGICVGHVQGLHLSDMQGQAHLAG